MIPTKPPPTLKVPQDWNPLFLDLISKCLVKNPEERTTAKCLLEVCFNVLTNFISWILSPNYWTVESKPDNVERLVNE